ncbi:MAG: VanW family protein [Candidatus Levybacteria bacterium]|nr:VanW family protein [Candidatus Levybacteria bacterium]
MFTSTLLGAVLFFGINLPIVQNLPQQNKPSEQVLSSRAISLEKRYSNKFVNDIFKDNILLNIAYMADKVGKNASINWQEIGKPFHYKWTLKPNEVFSFHDDVLPEYQEKIVKTTNAHFNSQEGFKSDGYLVGDGICHLASIIYWAAKDAGLEAKAPTNHDFTPIPEIPKEFGVAIYDDPGKSYSNQVQNLYITNNKNVPIEFKFDYDGEILTVSVAAL